MPLKLSPTQVAFNARGDGSFNQPFAQQLAFFRQKLNLPTEVYDDLLAAGHDRAFVVAGAMKADLLEDLRRAVDKAIAEGKSIQWFRSNFKDIVKKHGWEGYTGSATQAGRDWRTRVIYRTNIASSYAAGRWQQLNDPELLSSRPYWKYIHNDTVSHPRPLHVSWSGLVLKADDPFWQSHFPPNGWGCRCRITAVRGSAYKGERAPDDGVFSHEDSQGVTHTVPEGIDFGWNYAPGANRTTPLKDIIDQKLIRLPAIVGADMWASLKPALSMETQLQWTNTLDEWSNTTQKGRVAVVGAMGADVLLWLKSNHNTLPKTAEVSIREGLIKGTKQARHEKAGDGLNVSEWRELPRVINSPEQVLLDTKTGKLIYILSASTSGTKLAVEFDYRLGRKRTNMIVSGYRQSIKRITERINRGDWLIIK